MQTELSYFPGCELHGSARFYDTTVKKVLGEFGITLKEIEDWSCCGATSAHKTDHELAIALPARNLGIAQKDLKPVLAPCSSCYSRLVATNVEMQKDSHLAESINTELETPYTEQLPILSILEVLLQALEKEGAPEIVNPLNGLNLVSYYGCLLTRIPGFEPPDDVENPVMMDNILKNIGATPIDWSYKTDCCGASSAVADKPVGIDLIKKLLDESIESDAAGIVVSCPMCQLNLDMYQDEAKPERPVPIYLITELVGIALAFKKEMEKEIRRHFVDGVQTLKDLNLL